SPQAIATDPTGRFLYVSNGTSKNMSAYSINLSTGALTPVPGSPFPDAGGKIAMDPKGRLVYAKTGTSAVSVYSPNFFTGALTPVPGSPFNVSGTDTVRPCRGGKWEIFICQHGPEFRYRRGKDLLY